MASPARGNEMSMQVLLKIARRRAWLILLVTVVVTAGVGAFAYYRPVLYKAQALIGIESNTRDVIQKTDGPGRVQDQLITIREGIYSKALLEPVMRRYGVNDIEKFRNDLKITLETDDTFHLGYEGENRERVMNLVNDVANGFVGQLAQDRHMQQGEASQLLDAELKTLQATLDAQEEQLKHYKQRAVDSLPDRLDTNLRLLATTQAEAQEAGALESNDQAKLAAVHAELAELEKQGVLNQVQVREKTPNEIKLDDLRLHLKQLKSVYTDKYPEILTTEQEIADLQRLIASTPARAATAEPSPARMRYLQLKAERESLEQRVKGYAAQRAEIQSRANVMQSRVSAAPTHEIAISELSRGYEQTKTRYNTLLAKQQEMRLASGLERVNKSMAFKVVEPATLPLGPSTPRRSRLLLMGLLGGLGLGCLAAFGLHQMNATLGSVREFQSFTALPVLAALPNLTLDRKQIARSKETAIPLVPLAGSGTPTLLSPAQLRDTHMIALTDPESIAAEQYRLLALKVRRQFASLDAPILLVTGCAGGEGKTVTATNVSLSLANTHPGRVLLIDSDLRKPRVHEYLNIPRGKGFSELLRAPESDIDEFLWKIKDLYVMQGGTSLTNPVSLLTSKNAAAVLDRLRGQFDFIVIDTPPVLPVVDSHILSALADGVILVVRAHYTRRDVITLGLESFQAPNLFGAVINDLDPQGSGYASAYQYYNEHYAGMA